MTPSSTSPATILIVDDHPTNLQVLGLALSQAGYNVRVEMEGKLAIEQVKRNPPDLILLDVMLPDLNGFEVCQRLKADATIAHVPVIFMTALADTERKVEGLSVGAVDYITKPFQQEEVLARVQMHVRLSQMTQALDAKNTQLEQLTEELEQRVIQRTQALRDSEATLRQLTENIASAFWLTNLDRTEILYISPAYAAIWGRPSEELYQNPQQWIEAIHPDDRSRVQSAMTQQVQGSYDEEYRIIRGDGTIRWIRDRAFAIHDADGQVYRIAGIADDITSDRQLQQTLRLQRRAIEASNNGIVIVDAQQPDRPVIYVNPAFEKITGYSVTEAIGQNCRFLQGPEPDQEGLHILRNALSNHKSCTVNLRNYRKDGSLFWNELSISPIYDEHGSVSHYIGIQTEISDRKQYEERLKKSLKEKEVLLKEVHHRVKNNLLIVSSLLEFQADYLDDPKAIQGLNDSQTRIQSMALVHEKLYQSDDLGKIDFGSYVQTLLEQLAISFNLHFRKIQVNVEVDEIFLNIETITPCGIIINELISNICKHAFPDDREAKIWLSATSTLHDSQRLITLKVQDNGVGLPPDLDIYNTNSLGLQLVCLLTKQLEGEIKLSREQGTCFELIFSELNYADRV